MEMNMEPTDDELVEQMQQAREERRADPAYAAEIEAHRRRMLEDPAYAAHFRHRAEHFSMGWSSGPLPLQVQTDSNEQ